jgi:hypothetical protein
MARWATAEKKALIHLEPGLRETVTQRQLWRGDPTPVSAADKRF